MSAVFLVGYNILHCMVFFIGTHLPGVKSNMSEGSSWIMIIATTGEYSVLDLRCQACLSHPSAVTRGQALHWLTGVSNDSGSEVTSQHKHRGQAQLHATFDTQSSLRISAFSESYLHLEKPHAVHGNHLKSCRHDFIWRHFIDSFDACKMR